MVRLTNYNKLARYFKGQNKFFTLTALTILLLVISGILEPILIKNVEREWKEKRDRKITKIVNEFNSIITKKQEEFTKRFDLLVNKYTDAESKLENSLRYNEVFFVLKDNQKVYWNSLFSSIHENAINRNYKDNNIYFYDTGLQSYFAIYRNVGEQTYCLLRILDKHYSINNKFFSEKDLEKTLTEKYQTEFRIEYFTGSKDEPDGRYYSFEIKNLQDKTIGRAIFLKPPRKKELINIVESVALFQAVLIVAGFLFLSIGLAYDFRRLDSYLIKFILFFVFIAFFRMILHFVSIPSALFDSELNNVDYFSSVFAFGLVKSPLEFLISVLFLLIAAFVGYHFFLESLRTHKISRAVSVPVKAGYTILLTLMFLLGFRGVAASIKSVVFDASLRYFTDPSLKPDFVIAAMELGILLLGLSLVWMSVVFIGYYTKLWIPKFGKRSVLILFGYLQLSGYLFDALQNEPQATPILRIIFITLIFILVLLHLYKSPRISKNLVYSLFLASVVSISTLIYYNSELERESIKTTAREITRPNEHYIEFMVRETLNEVFYNESFARDIELNNNNDKLTFKTWCNSSLQNESFPAYLALLDTTNKVIGEFTYNFEESYMPDIGGLIESKPETIDIFRNFVYDSNLKVIGGVSPVKEQGNIVGYFVVAIIYDINSFGFYNLPDFLSAKPANLGAPVNVATLKIFNFHDDKLVKEFSDIKLTRSEKEKILESDFTKYNEKWLRMKINNEEHLVYVLLDKRDQFTRKLAVALKLKDTSWSLFDFFKVFFIHTFFIVLILIGYYLYDFRNTKKNLLTFRTQLLAAFLLIAIIPLLFLATYLRNLTEEKNNEAIVYKLNKRAVSVEEYLNRYLMKSSLKNKETYKKASRDLNINFTIFRNDSLYYSSLQNYINIGLLSDVMNYKSESRIKNSGIKEYIVKENIENYYLNSLYYKAVIHGDEYIIKVDDSFNTIMLPFAGVEVDIFIFGSYSLAVIFIIIISTILANQIASPIRQLTYATKSVASGDLSLELKIKSRGEIKELIEGFNYMLKKLKQNQNDMALLEREAAWKQMARQVAHEIKNPLTPMKLSVQQLIASFDDKPDKFREIFGKVSKMLINQIDILTNIASEFHAFARMPKINLKTINLTTVVNEVAYIFAQEKVNITSTSENVEIEILSDKDQLKRTLVNLIRNAIQASSKNITLNVSRDAEQTYIRVIDDGHGIKPELVGKIFEENFTTKTQGMGLGLNMARKFVESLNGTIRIEESSEKGTVFLIAFPISEEFK